MYKTIGTMSWWRIALGVALLILVLFIAGIPAELFARTGNFKAAQKLLIAPAWMEKYKAEEKDYIDAGVLFQEGDYDGAYEAFSQIDNYKSATAMEEVCKVYLAQEAFEADKPEEAYTLVTQLDKSVLSQEDFDKYNELISSLIESFRDVDGKKVTVLEGLISDK